MHGIEYKAVDFQIQVQVDFAQKTLKGSRATVKPYYLENNAPIYRIWGSSGYLKENWIMYKCCS